MARRFLPLVTLLGLTLLLTWPTVVTLTTHVVDRQDPLLNAWIMAWEARQLLVDPLHLYDANIFFPLRNTLAFSEILLSTSALVMPLQWGTGNALLSYNMAFLLSFFTTALGAYLLALYLTGHRAASLLAAVAFAWSPYRMGHLSQVQLLAFGWLPLALIYLDRLLKNGRTESQKSKVKSQESKVTANGGRQTANVGAGLAPARHTANGGRQTANVGAGLAPARHTANGAWQTANVGAGLAPARHTANVERQTSNGGRRRAKGDWWWVRDGALFGFFFLLQALASFYAALFSAMACVFYAGAWVLWQRRVAWQSVAGGALAALLVLLVMVPLSLPYFEVQRTLGAGWTLAQNEQFSASLQAYGYAPEGTWLWGALTRPLRYVYGPCCPPDTLFPGLTLLLLGGVALRQRGGRRGLWLGLALLAFVLSLGPTLTIRANEPTGIALPYRWLWEHVPGFNAIRAPVRWAVLVTLSLSMLAALGLARLRGRWAAPLAMLLLLLEFALFPLRLVPVPEPPASLAWLASQPPTRILELPLVAERAQPHIPEDQPRLAWESARLLETQFFSTYHWHGTPDGYSGYVPARHGDFAREMQGFPSVRAVALLRGLGVRYVVIHGEEPAAQHLVQPGLSLPEGVREVAHFGEERILEIFPSEPTSLPEVQLPLGALPPQQVIEVPLLLTASGEPYVPLRGEPLRIAAEWSQAGQPTHTEEVRVPLPIVVEELALLHLPLETPAAGEWTLALSGTFPTEQGEQPWHLEQPIQISAEAAQPPPLLPVRLEEAQFLDERTLALAWRSSQPLARYYSLSVRLLDDEGTVIGQQDGAPGGEQGTIAWLPGEVYSERWQFDLPAGKRVSDYRLVLLWYDPESGVPAWLWDGARFTEFLEIP